MQAQNGIVEFKDLTFIAEPGSEEVFYSFYASSIDAIALNEIFKIDSG